jgi:hypothetical protein
LRNYHGSCGTVCLSRGRLQVKDAQEPGGIGADVPLSFTDEGHGKTRLRLDTLIYFGIYRQQDDRVMVCFSGSPSRRPKDFRLTKTRAVLILHRVKPAK